MTEQDQPKNVSGPSTAPSTTSSVQPLLGALTEGRSPASEVPTTTDPKATTAPSTEFLQDHTKQEPQVSVLTSSAGTSPKGATTNAVTMSTPPVTVTNLKNRTCWICCQGDEEDQVEGIEPTWIHPCSCSLIAHETCLIEWAQKSGPRTDDIACPQCQDTYDLVAWKPALLQLGEAFDDMELSLSRLAHYGWMLAPLLCFGAFKNKHYMMRMGQELMPWNVSCG